MVPVLVEAIKALDKHEVKQVDAMAAENVRFSYCLAKSLERSTVL